jgi:hypothetical protein
VTLYDFYFVSLASLKVHFSLVPPSTRTALFNAVHRTRYDEKYSFTILRGLGLMQASWNELDEQYCEGLLERIRICINDVDGKVSNNHAFSSVVVLITVRIWVSLLMR